MIEDLKKVENFCYQIKNSEYPISLKSLIGISEETKNTLLRVINFHHLMNEKGDSVYTESELIKRFLLPSEFLHKRIKEVTGPISIHQMSSNKYPQIFYLFGDEHIKTEGCGVSPPYHIGDWIKDTISNSPVFIDVYVEKSYSYKNYPSTSVFIREKGVESANDYLDVLYAFFRECFYQVQCKNSESNYVCDDYSCKTSRFHYTDMRDLFETEEQLKGGIIFDKILRTSSSTLKNISDDNIEKIIKKINVYIDFFRDPESIIYRRIEKQFLNISDDHIRITISRKFKDCLKKNKRFLNPIKNKNIDYSKIFGILEYGTCLMDYYLIGRCFRNFKKVPSSSGAFKYSRPSYNNIIYSGDYHTNNYVNILLDLGFKIDFENYADRSGNFQCLDIFKMKQPMFHQRYS